MGAQLKSAVILAGLNSYGDTIIKEQIRSRDHTEKILKNTKAIKIKDGKKDYLCSKNIGTIINKCEWRSTSALFLQL